MNRFEQWNALIAPQDAAAMARAKAHWDGVAKPLDGLGKLETAVVRIAGVTGDENVSIDRRTVLVLCADNGIVREGVTQTDASVTATMARRIFEHRSSVCLMAKTARADVIPVDLGMLSRVPGVRDLSVASGTQNMAEGPAMTEAQTMRAIENGVLLAKERKAAGDRILVTGEMGIGNTSTSSAIASVLLDLPVETVTGRGAGLSDAGLMRKREAIKRLTAHRGFIFADMTGGMELTYLRHFERIRDIRVMAEAAFGVMEEFRQTGALPDHPRALAGLRDRCGDRPLGYEHGEIAVAKGVSRWGFLIFAAGPEQEKAPGGVAVFW